MGTETRCQIIGNICTVITGVKLNDPLMGTETLMKGKP